MRYSEINLQTEDIRWFAADEVRELLPPDISALPHDRDLHGGFGEPLDEQRYTLIVKGEAFPDRRKKS